MVRVVANITAAGADFYDEAVEVRRRVFGDHEPTVVTVMVESLLRPAAFIEVEVTATRGGAVRAHGSSADDMHRSRISEVADGTVYLPTMLPNDENGDVVAENDFAGQYRYCLERAGLLLETMGLDLSHVVKTLDFTATATRDEYRKCGSA